MNVFKVSICDHFGLEDFDGEKTMHFLDKNKAWEHYRGLIKKAHEREDLVKAEYVDKGKQISGNKRGKRSYWKGSTDLHRGVLAETTVCYWEEWNTPEGSEIERQIYTIEMHGIDVISVTYHNS